jgi:hypothetical protein
LCEAAIAYIKSPTFAFYTIVKNILALFFSALLLLNSNAQTNANLLPQSPNIAYSYLAAPPEILLPAFDINQAEQLDRSDAKDG